LDFDNLSEEDKAYLRSWNRHDEIPGEEPPEGTEPATGFESRHQEEAGDKSYDDMSKAELKAEIEKRNAGYDEEYQLSVSGNKDELISRLEEDDATEE
jgi:hypothetical protein